jgi:hypothetical protein
MRAALVFFAFVTSCGSSCNKTAELAHDSGFNPGGGASASAPSPAARPASTLTPQERRDLKIRVGNEDCERAAKRINTLHNRSETDLKGIEILSSCLKLGNMAFYRCVLDARAADEADACMKRFLQP